MSVWNQVSGKQLSVEETVGRVMRTVTVLSGKLARSFKGQKVRSTCGKSNCIDVPLFFKKSSCIHDLFGSFQSLVMKNGTVVLSLAQGCTNFF